MIYIVVGVICFAIFCGLAVFIYGEFRSRFNASSYDNCSDEEFKNIYLDPNYLLKLHYLLHVSNEILKAAKVQYVATSGTLLSIFRTGFLTPWDDDGDLDVFKPDFEANRKFIEELLVKNDVYLNDPFWIANLQVYQLKMLDGHPMQRKYPSDREPFVDWVLFEQMNEEVAQSYPDHRSRKVFHFSSARERELFPREYLFEEELYPIQEKTLQVFSTETAKRLKIENPTVTLSVPNLPISILDRAYGKKEDLSMWKKCYLASSHQSMGLFVKPCKLTEQQVNQLFH